MRIARGAVQCTMRAVSRHGYLARFGLQGMSRAKVLRGKQTYKVCLCLTKCPTLFYNQVHVEQG
jgi:hypothetical protein